MAYTAEIIGVGTEILLGNICNTDAQDVSQALSALGINVYFHTVVGDNPQRLRQAVEIARSRADIIITIGGLGPTYDDLTKQTLAEVFGKPLVFHEEEAERIRRYFKERLNNMEMTDNNLQQAWLPEGCVVLENSCGTAPGCAFESGGKHVIMLPGPPRECRAMLKTGAIPYLAALSDSQLYTHNIHVFGMGESSVEARLRDLMMEMTNPTLAPYAKDGEVLLRLTAKARSQEEAEAMMAPALEKVRAVLGDYIYGIDTGSLENTVLSLLREQKKTVAVAESCTGGLLSKRLTDLPGSSAAFLGGVTAYATRTKVSVLGVSEDVLKNNPVASRAVAEAMARRARALFGADFGIGITGVAGPDPDEDGTAPGTVFVALSTGDKLFCREPLHFTDRARVREFAASTALDMLRRYLTGRPV